jgi:FkbM family methyltransferase
VERAEWTFYVDYLREGMVVADVGAYVGELTLFFSRFCGPQGHVHAFEARSVSFNCLQALCALARYKNITANHVALFNEEGRVRLRVYDEDHSSWCTLADRPLHEYGIDVSPVGSEEVTATTLDDYCAERRVSRIDLLKIDVEGAEYDVLRGAQGLLEGKAIRCCVFEFGQTTLDMGVQPDEIRGYLDSCGYRVRNLIRKDSLFPGGDDPKTARYAMHVATPIP